jgi:site-specific DNA recombinase
MGGGQAYFEIREDEAEIVRKMFFWLGRDRVSIGEIIHRLNKLHPLTRTGKTYWSRNTIWGILRNTAYIGKAAFWKRKTASRLPKIRPRKGSSEHPKNNNSLLSNSKSNWIYISVPMIIDEDLFNAVHEQLEQNKKRLRKKSEGITYLLQGLLVCQLCNYSYCGSRINRKNVNGETYHHTYYRCTGSDAHRFGGNKICENKPIVTERLEVAVWNEVSNLLENPTRILEEYQSRILEIETFPFEQPYHSLEKQAIKLLV